MATLSSFPQYPIPAHNLAVVFSLTQTGTNFVRVWCTVAPAGSALDVELKKSDKATGARVQVYEGQGGTDHPWRTKIDKGGAYTLVAQEYTKGTGFGGGYEGDTRGAPTETKVGSEASLSLYVGNKIETLLGTGADRATLSFWVFNDTIRATTVATHGEATPVVTAPTSDRAATAAKSVGVGLAVLALIGQTATTARGNVSTIISNFVTKFNAHIGTAAAVHNAADANNPIKLEFSGAPTPQNITTFATEALRRLRQHEQNDWNGSGPGSADGSTDPVTGVISPAPYHKVGGVVQADMTNTPVMHGVGDTNDAYAALGDLWRAYEAHRQSTIVHIGADSTNTLTALSNTIADVHNQFFVALAATSPAASPGESSGAALLKTWGCKIAV